MVLPPMDREVVRYSALSGGSATVEQTARGIEIAVPPAERHERDTIVALELDGPALDAKAGTLASGSVAAGKKARASNVFENSPTYSSDKAFDDDLDTRWGCDWDTKLAWLEFDLGKPTTLGRAFISEPYGRVQQFAIEAEMGGRWRACARGTTIGERRALTFEPVTAQIARLNLLKTTEGPSIWEFQLFPPSEMKT